MKRTGYQREKYSMASLSCHFVSQLFLTWKFDFPNSSLCRVRMASYTLEILSAILSTHRELSKASRNRRASNPRQALDTNVPLFIYTTAGVEHHCLVSLQYCPEHACTLPYTSPSRVTFICSCSSITGKFYTKQFIKTVSLP